MQDKFGQIFEENVVRPSGDNAFKMHFANKKLVYVWNVATSSFERQHHIDENMKQSHFYKCKDGLGQLMIADRLQEYGENLIKISVPGVLYLLFHEVRKFLSHLHLCTLKQ